MLHGRCPNPGSGFEGKSHLRTASPPLGDCVKQATANYSGTSPSSLTRRHSLVELLRYEFKIIWDAWPDGHVRGQGCVWAMVCHFGDLALPMPKIGRLTARRGLAQRHPRCFSVRPEA